MEYTRTQHLMQVEKRLDALMPHFRGRDGQNADCGEAEIELYAHSQHTVRRKEAVPAFKWRTDRHDDDPAFVCHDDDPYSRTAVA